MSTTPTRVFVARLVGLPIFDPQGDQVAKVRDLVVALRTETSQPRVLGMVAEVFGRRRIFVPMTRITNIDSGQVHTTGLLNMRRFEQRSTETLVMGQMLDRTVTIKDPAKDGGVTGVVYDVAMEQARNRDWVLSRVAVQEPSKGFRRRGQTHVVEWRDVTGLTQHEPTQGATHLIAALNEMRPADAANVIHDLPPERRTAVVAALDDERLADVLEELPEEDQVEILEHLDSERAADVLEEMSADDAADLIADLQPGDRRDAARADGARGGRGRPAPDVLRRQHRRRDDDARAGDPLPRRHHRRRARPRPQPRAHARRSPRWSTSAASRSRRPTGKLLGAAHIQRLLREPPSTLVAAALDDSMDPLRPDASHGRGRRPPRDLQPGRRARRRRRGPPARRGHRRRPARPHAARGLARPRPAARPDQRRTERREGRGERQPPRPPRHPARHPPPARAAPERTTPTRSASFAEQFARFMGTAKFLLYMTLFVVVWIVLERRWRPRDLRFDEFPFIFLTLMLSLQASYAAPLILLAQNRQEQRDKVIAEQDRQANARAHADMEFLAREVASLRMSVGEVATRDFLRSELRGLLRRHRGPVAPRAGGRAGTVSPRGGS